MAVVIKGSGSIEGSTGLEMGANGTTEIRGQVNVAVGSSVAGVSTATNFAPTVIPNSNRRINVNGAFTVSQKNVDAAKTGINGSSRWIDLIQHYSSSGGTFTCQRVTDAPTGYKYSAKYTVTTANSSLAAGDEDMFIHRIEGQDLAHLSWGSSSAKTITLSFWVKSSLTGDFSVTIQGGGGRCYVTAYTISTADTWTKVTKTISGETSGTWVITNASGLAIIWDLGAGSTYEISSADTWVSVANDYRKAGTVRFSGTNAATWQITGIQFEVGSVDTPFEHRSYADELARCQRYYQVVVRASDYGSGIAPICNVIGYQTNNVFGVVDLPVTMRSEPTLHAVSSTGYWKVFRNGGSGDFNSVQLDQCSNSHVEINIYGVSSGTSIDADQPGWARSNDSSAFIGLTAEL